MIFPASVLAAVFGLGGPELILILCVVVLLFGAKKIPELAKGLGKSVKEFKKASAEADAEMAEEEEKEREKQRALAANAEAKKVESARTHTSSH